MKKLLIACVALLAVACSKTSDTASTTTAETATPSAAAAVKCQDRTLPAPSPQMDMTKKPVVTIPDGAPPCKLVVRDIKVGTGAEVKPGGTVTAQYVGVAWSSRSEFDSSWAHGGQPITFPLSNVIAGWQQGIPGMKEGGRRELIIPPDLGYGAAGQDGIRPGETLVFIVDLVKAA